MINLLNSFSFPIHDAPPFLQEEKYKIKDLLKKQLNSQERQRKGFPMKIKNRLSGNPCRGDNSRCGAVRERLCAALRDCARPAHVGAVGCQTAAGHVGALIPFCVFLFFLFILLFFQKQRSSLSLLWAHFCFQRNPSQQKQARVSTEAR